MEHNDSAATFLTVAEVAELLKLNQQTVRNWIDQGSLPAVKVGRRVRIKRSDLDHLVQQGYRSAGSAPHPSGPSAQDFWSGEPVGVAEVDPSANGREPAANDPQAAQDDEDSRVVLPLAKQGDPA
ncbi:MAG: helix-turn-helix domain-containing protein [Solirubrobacteraceae bacterium]